MLVSLVSAKGAPGVTTTGLALTLGWPRPVLLIDLDPRGGDVLWTFGQGQDTAGRDLLTCNLAARNASWADALWSHTVALDTRAGDDSGRWLLRGLDHGTHAAGIDWPGLAGALGVSPGVDVIADCGSVWSAHFPTPVVTAADLVLLVCGSSLAAVHAARGAAGVLGLLVGDRDRLGTVVVGPGRPYSTTEIGASMAVGAPVWGEVPFDPTAAELLLTGRVAERGFTRSALVRATSALGHRLGSQVSAIPGVQLQPVAPGSGASQVSVGVGDPR